MSSRKINATTFRDNEVDWLDQVLRNMAAGATDYSILKRNPAFRTVFQKISAMKMRKDQRESG